MFSMSIIKLTSLLVDKLQNLVDAFYHYVDLNHYNRVEAYKLILETFYQAIDYKQSLLGKDLRKDIRLLRMLDSARKFLDTITEVEEKYGASVPALVRETFRRARAVLANVPEDIPRYVIICDGLSIIDMIYIVTRLRKELEKNSMKGFFVAPLINPGGVTETYKFILEPHIYLYNGSLTLDDIAKNITKQLLAKEYIVFREYDRLLHQLKSVHVNTIVDTMFKLTSELYNKILHLKKEFHSVVVLISDHGYDIVTGDGMYKIEHFWRPRSLSIIASLAIV